MKVSSGGRVSASASLLRPCAHCAMRRVSRGAPALACAAMAGWCALAEPAHAARLHAAVRFGPKFDQRLSNSVTQVQAPRDTLRGAVAPELRLEGGNPLTRLEAVARSEFEFPFQRWNTSGSRSWHRVTDFGALRSAHQVTPAESLSLDLRYTRTHDPFEITERSALVSDDVTRWGTNGRADLWRAEGNYRLEGWSYAARGLPDALALSWNVNVLPVRHPEDAWLVGWRQRQMQIGGWDALRSHMAVVGYRRRISPLLSAQLEAGGFNVEYGDHTRVDGPVVALVLNGPTFSEGVINSEVRLHQDFPTSARAEIVRNLAQGAVSARWESLVDVEGGIRRDPNITRRFVVGGLDTLGRATVVGIEASRARTSPLHFDGNVANVTRTSAWVLRRMRPWLSARGGAAYLHQTGNGLQDFATFSRVRLDAGLMVVFE